MPLQREISQTTQEAAQVIVSMGENSNESNDMRSSQSIQSHEGSQIPTINNNMTNNTSHQISGNQPLSRHPHAMYAHLYQIPDPDNIMANNTLRQLSSNQPLSRHPHANYLQGICTQPPNMYTQLYDNQLPGIYPQTFGSHSLSMHPHAMYVHQPSNFLYQQYIPFVPQPQPQYNYHELNNFMPNVHNQFGIDMQTHRHNSSNILNVPDPFSTQTQPSINYLHDHQSQPSTDISQETNHITTNEVKCTKKNNISANRKGKRKAIETSKISNDEFLGLAVGDQVMAKFDGTWYEAKICKINKKSIIVKFKCDNKITKYTTDEIKENIKQTSSQGMAESISSSSSSSSKSSLTYSPNACKRGKKSFWTGFEELQNRGSKQRERRPPGFYKIARTNSQQSEQEITDDDDDDEDFKR